MSDLNEILMSKLKTLSRPGMSPEEQKLENDSGKIMSSLAKDVIAGAGLALEAEKFKLDYPAKHLPPVLQSPGDEAIDHPQLGQNKL